jgi:hypothetical protein
MDIFERSLYNALLPGVSFSGDRFFYPNPLAADGVTAFNHGHAQRAPWFGTSCCPVNVVRVLPSLPGYVYASRGDDVYVNLYIAGRATVETDRGPIRVEQETNYPWDGTVRIKVSPDTEGEFSLRLRIPGWATGQPFPSDLYTYHGGAGAGHTLSVNGREIASERDQGYAVVRRVWEEGDEVTLGLPMPVRFVRAHERVEQNRGRVAIERGPLVYCFEGVDNGGDLDSVVIEPGAEARWSFAPELLAGVGVIEVAAQRASMAEDGLLRAEPVTARAVPYYAWAHREPGPMAVWMPATPEIAANRAAPTLASRAAAGASHCWPSDSVGALNDLKEPTSSSDQSIPRLTWWNHTGTAEWAQLDFGGAAEISAVEVYWFDDTGRGMCRAPESWRVVYRDGGEWKPVAARGDYPVAKDRYCRVDFEPVMADAVRVEVELREGFSGGMLEMRLE